MRTMWCVCVMVSAMVSSAGAQSPGGQPSVPPVAGSAIDVTKAALEAAAKVGLAALKPGVSVSDRNISVGNMGGYNVAVAYVTRPATKVPSGRALSHDKITEIYYVVSGRGTQVTGALANATKEQGSTTIGPGYSSTSAIVGGRSTTLGPGEMQIIPPGVGHVWTEIAEGGIVYMVIRVDPEHLLAPSK